MRRRLYFILPDTKMAENVEDELLLARIDAGHMHFLSTVESTLGRLPKASILQKTDLAHAMALGLVVGGLTGIVLGLLLLFNPAWGAGLGSVSAFGMILGLSVGGAIFGCWVSGMIGVSCPSVRLRAFKKQIEQGDILLMVDVHKERVEEITRLIKSHHPEADVKGVEATIPAFP
ncbi:MAG: DUF1269 domain-containing protein [Pseudomonadota bacterium]